LTFRQASWDEPLIHELDNGRRGLTLAGLVEEFRQLMGELSISPSILREEPPQLPEVSEVEVIRHYTRLSEMSYGVDNGPVPLGSCTMKYNPKVALRYAFDERLQLIHPLEPEDRYQGVLRALYELQRWLAAIVGMDSCSLGVSAGAQGELAGVLTIKRYHELKGSNGPEDRDYSARLCPWHEPRQRCHGWLQGR
jgi:glycine dehydrogenase (decarboxylating) beta subunit (EC 1.4.4.2)